MEDLCLYSDDDNHDDDDDDDSYSNYSDLMVINT